MRLYSAMDALVETSPSRNGQLYAVDIQLLAACHVTCCLRGDGRNCMISHNLLRSCHIVRNLGRPCIVRTMMWAAPQGPNPKQLTSCGKGSLLLSGLLGNQTAFIARQWAGIITLLLPLGRSLSTQNSLLLSLACAHLSFTIHGVSNHSQLSNFGLQTVF